MPIKKSEVARQVEKEHEFLKRDLGEIKMKVMENISAKDFPDWRLEFIWRLRDFKNRLLRHFELEEKGGFMSEVLREAPQVIAKVKALEEEHRQIVENLDGILATCEAMQEKDASRLEAIRSGISELLTTIRQHEAAENSLMQIAYYQEFGGQA
jgi:hemerythrin